jgi:hypothetical protein
MTDYASFRQRLDAVLRTLDVQQVQQFLIGAKQWSSDALPADPEFTMYMMIAGSVTMRDLHERARLWLESHGHTEEAQAMLGVGKKAGAGTGDQRNAKSGGGGSRAQNPKRGGPPQGRGRPH